MLKCGIVGLPNVGKSTLFNALTKTRSAQSENYPFCTIDPNVGIVEVPDIRLNKLVEIIQPKSIISAHLEFIDIAGLVKGAAKGEGLGNQFLSHIRQVQTILHVVRCFEDKNVTHVVGDVDPIRDIEIIELELIYSDKEQVERNLSKLKKSKRSGDKEMELRYQVLEQIDSILSQGKPARMAEFSKKEFDILSEYNLLSMKPIILVANILEDYISSPELSEQYKKLYSFSEANNMSLLPISAKIESELIALSKEEEQEFLKSLSLTSSGLDKVIQKVYSTLGYMTYFTAGVQEVKAWTIQHNTKAPQAAGEIHTDMERGFIKAEVISFDDFMQFKDTKKAQEFGKVRLEGKDYIVKDGDIIHFKFNV